LTVILEKKTIGGNASWTKSIENYQGFDFISDPDLIDKMASQPETYGVIID
jgi:thioredoxin reductase (NADPH)